jgi:hypothetical protein
LATNVYPEAGDAGDVGAALIDRQSQHVGVKLSGLLHLFGGFADANAMMV